MLTSLTRLSALLLGVALLLTGHGLQLTLIPLKAQALDWNSVRIGTLTSFYFIGFVIGCFGTPLLVHRIGHIRSFAMLVTAMTASILGLSIASGFPLWILLRVATGASISGLYLVVESWLNEQTSNDSRGSVLSAYTVIVLAGLAGGQLLLNVAEPAGDRLIVLSALFIVLAAIPVCLTSSAQPQQIPRASFSPLKVLRTSRAASSGAIIAGLVSGTIYGLGPVYGMQSGLDVMGVSIMMALTIVGGALAQFPLGRFSDRVDRRLVILACLLTGSAVAVVGLLLPSEFLPYIMFGFGAAVVPIYALSLALASDNAEPGSFLQVGTGLLMLNAAGSISGPLIVSQLMYRFGSPSYFVFHLSVLLLGAAVVFLFIKTKSAAEHTTADFKIATSAAAQGAFELDPRGEPEQEAEAQGADSLEELEGEVITKRQRGPLAKQED